MAKNDVIKKGVRGAKHSGKSTGIKGDKRIDKTVGRKFTDGQLVKKNSKVVAELDHNTSENSSSANSATRSVLAETVPKPESRLTAIEKMEATKEGISKKALESLKDRAGLDYDQLSLILGAARSTLFGKKGAERFSQELSEKIMSLADIYSYGYEVFGDQGEFNEWIFGTLPALGGKTPFDFLSNQYGREEVRHLIGRIAYGVYS